MLVVSASRSLTEMGRNEVLALAQRELAENAAAAGAHGLFDVAVGGAIDQHRHQALARRGAVTQVRVDDAAAWHRVDQAVRGSQ